ncbi:MAG TPA: PAS domain S-box protein [Candidatus Limnocylindrales bacterium]|nr:PAS domain S-box protein [Candidatus Limnocylindrales bacterium]
MSTEDKNKTKDHSLKPSRGFSKTHPVLQEQIERVLYESEAHYRAIVEEQTELVCRWFPDGTLTFVNEAYCRYFGKKREELIGRSFMPLIPWEDYEKFQKHFKSLNPENPVGVIEHRVLLPHGEIRWQQWVDRAIFDDQGCLVEFQSVGRDITEQKRTEEKLRQWNAYLEALHETAIELINRLDLTDLLQAIVTRAGALVGTQHGYMLLVEGTEMVVKVAVGVNSEFIGYRIKLEEGMAGRVWQTGQPLTVKDYRTWPHRLPDPRFDIFHAVVTVPLKSGSQVVGVLTLNHLEEGLTFGEDEIMILSRFAELASIALDNARLYTSVQQELAERKRIEEALRESEEHYRILLNQACEMQETLRSLSKEVLRLQEEERKRISRELHDEIGQALTAINMNLEMMKKEIEPYKKNLHKRITDTQNLVAQMMESIHRFSRELRPAILDDLGLIPALRSYTKSFAERTGIRVYLRTTSAVEKLDSERKTVLYRIIQESLTNVSKHAQAHKVNIGIRNLKGRICLVIQDDGKTARMGQQVFLSRQEKRLGLLGMQERVRYVNGEFSVESEPGKGTTIRVEIPF